MAKVGIDLHTFEMLRDNGGPLTTSHLAEKSGAAPELLGGFCCAQCVLLIIYGTLGDGFTRNVPWLTICRARPARPGNFQSD